MVLIRLALVSSCEPLWPAAYRGPGVVGAAQASAGGWEVSGGDVVVVCPLTIGGSFEATTTRIEGALSADPARGSALIGEVAVDLTALDTGIGLRNRHLAPEIIPDLRTKLPRASS
jgi:polyisoprenoid-binding protein YceI